MCSKNLEIAVENGVWQQSLNQFAAEIFGKSGAKHKVLKNGFERWVNKNSSPLSLLGGKTIYDDRAP